MGYYTNFYLDVMSSNGKRESSVDELVRIAKRINELETCTVFNIDYGFVCGSGDIKWYDWKKRCKVVSEEFPNYVIKISWEGEDIDDVGVCYFFRGKHQFEKFIAPPFDKSKLVEVAD